MLAANSCTSSLPGITVTAYYFTILNIFKTFFTVKLTHSSGLLWVGYIVACTSAVEVSVSYGDLNDCS